MNKGIIKGIYTAPTKGAAVSACKEVFLKQGKGIVGDRYYSESGENRSNYRGQPDWQVTFIESEEIAQFNRCTGNNLHEGDFRRNLVTEGIRLNNLLGKQFSVSGVNFYAVQLCEPCAGLQKRLRVSIFPHLLGRCGLRAQILSSGMVQVADNITAPLR